MFYPRLENAVDHAVLLVSNPLVIPPRREIRVLVEAPTLRTLKLSPSL
jgi:hypothetical protein